MKKRDIIVIALVLAVAGILFAVSSLGAKRTAPQNLVSISVGSEVYKVLPLDEPQVLHIDQGSGVVNDVEITAAGEVFMAHSSCSNQECVKMGTMTAENIEERPLGAWIVCLPHQVTVELQLAAEGGQ